MATPTGAELRRAPRLDVFRIVKGELVSIGAPITVLNLSRTGFAIMSEIAFEPGERIDFKLTAPNGTTIRVTAEAVHFRRVPHAPGSNLTGFRFVPGDVLGIPPYAAIDKLIEAVLPMASVLG
jgi:hypothetical protein